MGSESMAMRPKSKWAIDTEAMRARGIIDLFTDTAAILNLLHLSSTMGCPGGTRSVFTRAFWAKENFSAYFSAKRRSFILHPSTVHDLFCSHHNLFLRKRKEKLARKARVNTDASISDRAYAPLGIP